MTILDRLQKARLEVNDLKNTASRALYAIDKAIDEATPTPTPTPVPDPEPDPVPEPPPVGDGENFMGEIKTPTGGFQVFDLGQIPDGTAYRINDDALLVRWPDGDGTIDEIEHVYEGTRFTILPGSIKSGGKRLVEADPERLLKAVNDGRCLPYSIRAFDGWPGKPSYKAEPEYAYAPHLIHGRSGMNSGIAYALTGAGGEYGSSRGFIAADDVQMIAGVVDGNETQFAAAAEDCFSDVLYGLSLPNLAIWSQNHDCLRDPQVPFDGDRLYYNEGTATNGDQYGNEGSIVFAEDRPEIGAVAGTKYTQTRDEAHLFNHGAAWHMASGDPRAALLLQATAAYMLASNYRRMSGVYNPRFGYQRSTVNQFNALWWLRDVSLHASGPLLWNRARADKMVSEMWSRWETMLAAMDAATDVYSRSSTAIRGIDLNSDNAQNTYQSFGYGIEAAYLWARAGRPALLRRLAEHLIIRFGLIGGTRGYYGHGSGSGFAVLVGGKMPYDGTAAGLVKWSQEATQWPADSFDGAPAHYVLRAWWGLRMAAEAVPDANVEGVTAEMALAVMDAARAKTVKMKDVGVIDWKHAGMNFNG